MTNRAWARGALTLALIGGLAAALIAAPVGAAKNVTRKKVKKISTNIFNSLLPAVLAGKQNTCQPGAVLAWAYVDASPTFSSTYTTAGVSPQFNCAGGPVEVRRSSEGVYRVRIPGLSNGAAANALFVASVGTSDAQQGIGADDVATYDTVDDAGERVLGVVVADLQNGGDADNAALNDDDFAVAVYGIGTGTAPPRTAGRTSD